MTEWARVGTGYQLLDHTGIDRDCAGVGNRIRIGGQTNTRAGGKTNSGGPATGGAGKLIDRIHLFAEWASIIDPSLSLGIVDSNRASGGNGGRIKVKT